MASWYVDYVNGLDANPGTSVSPKKTVQAAVNLATKRDVIYLANTGNHVLAAPITWGTGFTNTGVGWLVFNSWDNGGSETIQRPDEATPRVAALFNGTDTISGVLGFGPPAVVLRNLKMTNFTSVPADPFGGGPIVMDGCEIYGQSGTQYIVLARGFASISNNYFHSNTTTRYPVILSDGASASCYNNWIESSGATAAIEVDNHNDIFNNVIVISSANVAAILITNNAGYIYGNTIIANSLANQFVISKATSNFGKVYNNVTYGFNGTGSKPFSMTGTAYAHVFGRNAYFDCNANTIQAEGYIGLDLSSSDVSASGNPFVDSVNGDYTLNDTVGAVAKGIAVSNYNSFVDIGAIQSAAAGGGSDDVFMLNE